MTHMTASQRVAILIGIFVLACLPRVFTLDAFISADEEQWLRNVTGFKQALEEGELKGLYQQPHPGITTMWVAVSTIDSEDWGVRRLPQAIVLSLLTVFATYLASRAWGWGIGSCIGILIALNPHFVAHSRVLAMDAFLAIFLLIGALAHLNWFSTREKKFLILSGTAVSLAVLSKVSALVMVAFLGAIFFGELLYRPHAWRTWLDSVLVWTAAFLLTLVLVFPTLISDPAYVFRAISDFFHTEQYQGAAHAGDAFYYLETILIWATPTHMVSLLAAIGLLWTSKKRKLEILFLICFAFTFFISMQLSIKKGDRYILPVFLVFDVLAVLFLSSFWQAVKTRFDEGRMRILRPLLAGLILVCVGWQAYTLIHIHPHYLAYRNWFSRPTAEARTMGWGEGLELAAEYLNAKPDVEDMLVISHYETPFSYRFKGKVTSAERLGKESLPEVGGDYVVLYRAMEGRASDRWETKVLEQFKDRTPEHIISLNGEEYVWIYNVQNEKTTMPTSDATSEEP